MEAPAPARNPERAVELRGTGSVSQFIGLLSRIDSSSAVVCQDRTLTVVGRYTGIRDFASVVRQSGINVTGPGPWRFGCEGQPDSAITSSSRRMATQTMMDAEVGGLAHPDDMLPEPGCRIVKTSFQTPNKIYGYTAEGAGTFCFYRWAQRLAPQNGMQQGTFEEVNGIPRGVDPGPQTSYTPPSGAEIVTRAAHDGFLQLGN